MIYEIVNLDSKKLKGIKIRTCNGKYDFYLSYEVENNPHIITYSGKYAKFILNGNPHIIIPEFWKKLWSMDINRNYQFDFEEYLNNTNDFENQEIHVYISIK